MFLKPLSIICVFILGLTANACAQDTLPRITVKNIGNKVLISWRNTYGAKITNINIQRSSDSIKNFTSIGSVLDPNNRENGFVDSKAPSPNMFYRVFVSFYGGSYAFSKSSRPYTDSGTVTPVIIPPVAEEIIITNPGFVASKYIYTGKDNNVIIDIPDAAGSKYAVKFFDDNDKMVFEIPKITEPFLIIEKVNFLRSGWFYFKLYENSVMKEQKEFYIPKEGKHGIPPEELKKKF